jgi:hypothetical protein
LDESAVRKPVGAEHLESLEAQMDKLRVAIELDRRSDFADQRDGAQANRGSFLAHFPELERALEEWDSIVDRAQAAPGSVWGWFAQATNERGFSEPPFAVGRLIDRLATLTVERARHGRLDKPHRLALQHFGNRSTCGDYVSMYVEGENVAQLPAESGTNPQRQITTAERRVQALFDDAQSCKQAEEVASATAALRAIKQPLLDRLAHHASADAVVFAASCPLCLPDGHFVVQARRCIARNPDVSSLPGLSVGHDPSRGHLEPCSR